MAHRVLTQIVIVGFRVVGRAFVEAYRQAQASAKYAKASQGGAGAGATIVGRAGITVDEACKILNIKPAEVKPETIASRYELLFQRNDPKKGGSFYLQSKIHRARERLDAEAKKAGAEGAKPSSGGGAA